MTVPSAEKNRVEKRSLLSALRPILKSKIGKELFLVYASGLFPFFGSLLRDFAILSRVPVSEATSFFKYFFLSNLVALIPAEYIWTKYNSLPGQRARIPAAEIGLMAGLTVSAGYLAFRAAGATSWFWTLVPVLSVIVAYPIGIYNGLKLYLPSKIVSTLPNIIMAGFTLVLSFHLPASYSLSLVIVSAVVFSFLAGGKRIQITAERFDIGSTLRMILLTAIPLAAFYSGNFYLLGLNHSQNRAVLWGNRISSYLLTFLILATPVFINTLKSRSFRVRDFSRAIRAAVGLIAFFLVLGFILRRPQPHLYLIVLNVDLSFLAALLHYLIKVIVVRRLHWESPEPPG